MKKLPIFINFLFYPWGYYFLKNKFRFVFVLIFYFAYTTLQNVILWIGLKISKEINITLSILVMEVLARIVISIDTYYQINKGEAPKKPIIKRPISYIAIPIIVILMLIGKYFYWPISSPIIRLYSMKSYAMFPTFTDKTSILFNCFDMKDDIDRGSIVNFSKITFVEKPLFYILRVIGLPGDTIIVKNNTIFLNNHKVETNESSFKIDETRCLHLKEYFNRGSITSVDCNDIVLRKEILPLRKKNINIYYDILIWDEISQSDYDEKYQLTEDEYFVIGDFRSIASDSRSWGPLKYNEIDCVAY